MKIFFRIIIAFFIVSLVLLIISIPRIRENWGESSLDEFKKLFNFDIMSKMEIIKTGNDHGGFSYDGEFYLIGKLQTSGLKEILNQEPEAWKRGPIPNEIAIHAWFDQSPNNEKKIDFMENKSIYYTANEECCIENRWNNGQLLMIDLEKEEIWYSDWDF